MALAVILIWFLDFRAITDLILWRWNGRKMGSKTALDININMYGVYSERIYSRFPFRKIMIYAVIASAKSSDELSIQPLIVRFEWLMLFAAVIFLIAFVQSTKMDSLLKMDFSIYIYTLLSIHGHISISIDRIFFCDFRKIWSKTFPCSNILTLSTSLNSNSAWRQVLFFSFFYPFFSPYFEYFHSKMPESIVNVSI